MALFGNRGAPKYVRLGTVPVPFVHLGEDLVYDGTTPAIVPLPRAHATATALAPSIGGGAAITLPVATAVSEGRVPIIAAGGSVAPAPATATATAAVPEISAGASVTLPSATALAVASLPEIQVVASGEILLPRAEAVATALVPTVSVVAVVSPPTATAVAEALAPTITASGELAAPTATATADALLPTVTAGAAITLPTAQASAMGRVPSVAVPGAITLPTATATAAALAVTVITFLPSGMNKSGTQSISAGSSTSYTQVTGWTADTATYPGSAVSSNALVAQADHAGAKVTGSVRVSSSLSSTSTVRLKRNGTVIATGTATSSGTNRVATVEATGVALTAGDLITIEVVQSTFTSHTVQTADTWVRILDNAPPPEPTLVASDGFNRASLGSDWTTAGGGTLYITGSSEICGVGMPSEPMSYAFWATPVSSGTQIVRAKVRWAGRDPAHSAAAVVLRANPSGMPSAGASGVQFWFTRDLMGILYEDPGAPNGFRPATGTADYVSTSKFPEGAVIQLKAEGTTYTASVNGSVVLSGTISSSIIPLTNHYVGVMIQDDSAVSGGGQPPANLDDWEVLIL